MWSYKLISKSGGRGRDNWYMVKNEESMPQVSMRNSSYEEVESLFRWFGTMEYAIYDDLRVALCADEPTRLALQDPPALMTAQYTDVLEGWSGIDRSRTATRDNDRR